MDDTNPNPRLRLCCFPILGRHTRKQSKVINDDMPMNYTSKESIRQYSNDQATQVDIKFRRDEMMDEYEDGFTESDLQISSDNEIHSTKNFQREHSATITSLDVLFSRVSLSGSICSANHDEGQTVDTRHDEIQCQTVDGTYSSPSREDDSSSEMVIQPLHSDNSLPPDVANNQLQREKRERQKQRESVISMISSGYGSFKDSLLSTGVELSGACEILEEDVDAMDMELDMDTPPSSLESSQRSVSRHPNRSILLLIIIIIIFQSF